MGHGREVYFQIAISSLPGYQQFLPLDKIFQLREKVSRSSVAAHIVSVHFFRTLQRRRRCAS
jgi:hypothetical protein